MKNKLALMVLISVVVLSLGLFTGCEPDQQIVTIIEEQGPNEPISPHYEPGYKAAKDYMAKQLTDYRLVIVLNDIASDGREGFLAGFAAAFTEANKQADGIKYSEVLLKAVTGDQFDRARKTGTKHAGRLITNSQIQSLIHGSLGISGSVTLGWKAGYIQGFKTQKVSEAKSPDKKTEERFYKEAAAMYNALRAAIGQ